MSGIAPGIKLRLSNFSEIGFPEMAAALAHEIKNPAAVAMAHVNLIRQEQELEGVFDSRLSDHMFHIEQAIIDICDLVQEMLFAIYNWSQPYEINLHEMLMEMLDTYRAAWPGITFALETDAPLICYGQESSLRMVFSNLLKNAVEAVEEFQSSPDLQFTGQIAITAHTIDTDISSPNQDEAFFSIAVHNNGLFLNHTDKPHGNGLGLAICRHLLHQMGGRLEIFGNPGEGCTAMVSLPVTCPPPPA